MLLKWAGGGKLRHKYMVNGDYYGLLPYLSVYSGIRAIVENAIILLSSTLDEQDVENSVVVNNWKALQDVSLPISGAFLLFTDYYKETIFVGPVRHINHTECFVKVFKNTHDAVEDEQKAQMFYKFAKGLVTLPVLQRREKNIVFYELVKKRRNKVDSQIIEDLAIKIGLHGLNNTQEVSKISDVFNLEKFVDLVNTTCNRFGASNFVSYLFDIENYIPIALSHGDFTPWNAFMTNEERICLVDYERVDFRTPFYDVFHLYTQPEALKGSFQIPEKLIIRLARIVKQESETVLFWYSAYLISQLEMDLSLLIVGKKEHKRLKNLIESKYKLLKRVAELLYETK